MELMNQCIFKRKARHQHPLFFSVATRMQQRLWSAFCLRRHQGPHIQSSLGLKWTQHCCLLVKFMYQFVFLTVKPDCKARKMIGCLIWKRYILRMHHYIYFNINGCVMMYPFIMLVNIVDEQSKIFLFMLYYTLMHSILVKNIPLII